MYCIECGTQIPDGSKFYSHCGKKQDKSTTIIEEKITKEIIDVDVVKQVFGKARQSLDYQFLRKAKSWYFAWVMLHLGLLLIGSNGAFDKKNMGSSRFWPFGYETYFDRIGKYDITEFLVYTIFPLAILLIWSMIRSQSENQEENNS